MNAMGSRHDVFVVDDRSSAVELALVREHGHPRILVHVRRDTTNDPVLFTQGTASFNTHAHE